MVLFLDVVLMDFISRFGPSSIVHQHHQQAGVTLGMFLVMVEGSEYVHLHGLYAKTLKSLADDFEFYVSIHSE